LVIDEADSLLFDRERAQRSWEISFTNEFLTQMERFCGILICTTNLMKDLDSASIRRFNHKIGFNYLDVKGNLLFYNKMLIDLVNAEFRMNELQWLNSITGLSPGDFKTVRNNHVFYSEGEVSHQILISALNRESQFKKRTSQSKRIGF